MEFQVDISNAVRGLEIANQKVRRGIALYGQTASLKMEAWAKAHRPWTDRTHNARNTIKGISGWGYVNAKIKLRKTDKKNEYGNLYEISFVDNPTRVGYGDKYVVGVTGNMPYSPWLEYRQFPYAGSLAVLWPAVNALTAETIKGWAAMLNALR